MNAHERNQLETWLNQLHGLLDRFDSLWGQRATLQQRFQSDLPHGVKWNWWMIVAIFLGIFFSLITILFPFLGFITNLILLPFSLLANDEPLQVPVDLIIWTLAIFLSIGPAIAIVVIRNRVRLPKTNAKIDVFNQQRRAANHALAEQINSVDQQIAKTNTEFQAHMREIHRLTGDGFPERYINKAAVAFCWHMVHDHRANTIGQAVNLYEEQLRHNEQLRHQQKLIEETQRVRKQVMLGTVVNAVGIGVANANAVAARKQSAANAAAARRQSDANTQRIIDNINKPQTIYVKRG